MLRHPILKEYVETKSFSRLGVIEELNWHYGWIRVKWFDGTQKYYTWNADGCQQLSRPTKERIADYLLKLENAGITDYWSD